MIWLVSYINVKQGLKLALIFLLSGYDITGTGSGSGADSSEVGDDEVEMSTYQNRNC